MAAYVRDLNEFTAFLRDREPGTSLRRAGTCPHVREYIAQMFDARGYDSRTVCRKLSSIRALYRFLKITGVREDDPAAAIPGPSVAKKRPAPLKVDEVMKLLRTTIAGRSDEARQRDHAIMELFYASGMRRAELAGVRLADVDLEERTIKVTGKGNKERVVVIDRTAATAIDAYLRVRPRSADPHLFLGRGGKGLTPKHVWQIFRAIYTISGVAKHASPHTLRHYLCNALGRKRRGSRDGARVARARKPCDDGRLLAACHGPQAARVRRGASARQARALRLLLQRGGSGQMPAVTACAMSR